MEWGIVRTDRTKSCFWHSSRTENATNFLFIYVYIYLTSTVSDIPRKENFTYFLRNKILNLKLTLKIKQFLESKSCLELKLGDLSIV